MTRKTTNNKANADDKPEISQEQELTVNEQGAEPEAGAVAVSHYSNIVLQGKAKKLSPKTENHVFYELAVHDEENELYLRLSGNEGGGLHSKEWIKLQDILTVLEDQDDKSFKSTALKPVFKGGSANNSGFLAASLRGLLLISPSEKSVFLHVLAENYTQRCDELLSLVGEADTAK
ncbi:hypothetical protein [Photobacterium sp. OFAV2-7]|uniref:hypothetical protein n=1 Tax=Photobacterium sp. OFAV2-7 TaxID=2917748 RepID=UPI001EF4F77D|nr:hypothetical protein [Photobacterium sp. OFAV2-7]MCG7584956.1 hypothetical protein [Photobacterium sp. OFAV2-7]